MLPWQDNDEQQQICCLLKPLVALERIVLEGEVQSEELHEIFNDVLPGVTEQRGETFFVRYFETALQ